jgi:tetratricopeptide (TPR) repeat protein
MSDTRSSLVPAPKPSQRKVCADQFEKANQAVAKGNYDYAIALLFTCCKLDPANAIYRQALRRTEKAKYPKHCHWLAWLTTWTTRSAMRRAMRAGQHLKALELGEQVLMRNPYDVPTQSTMAEAADALGLLDLAIWILEQARQKALKKVSLHRALAHLYEKRGNFSQAMALWELIRKWLPTDAEAMHKAKDLAASETIARGGYDEIGPSDPDAPTPLKMPEPIRRARHNTPARTEALPKQAAAREPEPTGPLTGNERLDREITQARKRLQVDPTSTASYLQLANCFRQSGNLDEARKVLKEGLGPTGNAFDLSAELADLEIETFRKDLAITEEKLRSSPDDAELRRLRGTLRKEVNNRELELHRQKADRYPADMTHRFEVGVRLFQGDQIEDAIRELQAAKNDARLRWQALHFLGQCFKAKNNWRLAQRNFEEALQSLPSAETEARKDLLFLLAQGHAESGDLSRAIDLGSELANQDYSFRDIGRLLDEWQDRMQKA